MKIRSITCFASIGDPAMRASAIDSAGRLAREAKTTLEDAGFPVQTTRLATQPLSHLPTEPVRLAGELWELCAGAGFDYLSLGPVLTEAPSADLSLLDIIPALIQATETVFASVLVATKDEGPNLEAIRRTAEIVGQVARTTALGFGNLRLAVMANVGPHAPFFPAAYHDGGTPAVAIATESADLAVSAFSGADAGSGTLDQARSSMLERGHSRLIEAVEDCAGRIAGLIAPLSERHSTRFAGIDFSLAPFPEEARSIGAAVERMGVDRFGAPGTLFAVAQLTDCLRKARYPRCGFNGVMLPVLEDATLAARSLEETFTVDDLLLYSAVCGTGLDTVPLPGDASDAELAGILLDVATLAVRLDKPLTARLMPIPGARAGDITQFDFDYFANGRVLGLKGWGSRGVFAH
jgi:uncharacterized protein (UPF0210 family)